MNLVSARESFARQGYCAMPSLVEQPHLGLLGGYYRSLVAQGGMRLGDKQSDRRWVARNELAARGLHHRLLPVMSAVAGVPVKTSYTYTAVYESGADLPSHVDRAQCEYSISICVDFEPRPAGPTGWPLWLDTGDGPVAIDQALGDGLFFMGRRLPHYRYPLMQGCRSTSIFLHYIDVE